MQNRGDQSGENEDAEIKQPTASSYNFDYLFDQLKEPAISHSSSATPFSPQKFSIAKNLLEILSCSNNNNNNTNIDIDSLRPIASQGIPNECIGLRALVWKVILGYLPRDRSKWLSTLKERRASYNQFIDDFLSKPKVPPQDLIAQHKIAEQSEELPTDQNDMKNSNNCSTPETMMSSMVLRRTTISTAIEKLEFKKVTDHPLNRSESSNWNTYFSDTEMFCQIEKDTDRTRTEIAFFTSQTNRKLRVGIPFQTYAREQRKKKNIEQGERHCEVLSRILFIYAKLHTAVQYVQGMNELLAPIYFSFYQESKANPSLFASEGFIQVEADAFFCFVKVMNIVKDRFMLQMDEFQQGIRSKCHEFGYFLEAYDPPLSAHFQNLSIDPQFYSLRWLLLMYSQEFPLPAVMRLWDMLLGQQDMLLYLNYIGLAIIEIKRDEFSDPEFANVMMKIQRLEDLDVEDIISRAARIQSLHVNHQSD